MACLPGGDPYEKVKGLVTRWSKMRADPAKAKCYYDTEVKNMGKLVRKLGRGGKGDGRGERDQEGLSKWKKWKCIYTRVIKRKKRECWDLFCATEGNLEPWKVASSRGPAGEKGIG